MRISSTNGDTIHQLYIYYFTIIKRFIQIETMINHPFLIKRYETQNRVTGLKILCWGLHSQKLIYL